VYYIVFPNCNGIYIFKPVLTYALEIDYSAIVTSALIFNPVYYYNMNIGFKTTWLRSPSIIIV